MKQFLLALICAFCSSCSQQEQKPNLQAPLETLDTKRNFRDFGENSEWRAKLKKLSQKNKILKGDKFHILQIGDSHTAGDYFSDSARKYLQAQFGNGGAGFFQPNKVSGQRNALINFEGGANTHSSKSEGGFFNLGGVSTEAQPELKIYERDNFLLPQKVKIVASTFNAEAVLELKDGKGQIFNLKVQNQDLAEFQHLNFKANLELIDAKGQVFNLGVKADISEFQHLQLKASLPLRIIDDKADWVLHGFSLERPNFGLIYSSVGINGAMISMLDRWSFDESLKFINPDMVILSFGTNEAFNSIDSQELYQNYMNSISRIRTALPQVAIVIIGAPESLRSLNGNCGTRPAALFNVQASQLKAATDARTLYWSWEQDMGGICSMKKWINQGWAGKDGVHFSKTGYEKSGISFAKDLIQSVISKQ